MRCLRPLPAIGPVLLLSAALASCSGEFRVDSGALEEGPIAAPPVVVEPECVTLDFDTDAAGDAIAPGASLAEVYAGFGIRIDTTNADGEPGLGVAFDADNPTGGDDDLSFPGMRNILISQEHPTDAERAAGVVEEPDDDARGAQFDFVFPAPVCVSRVTLLDIDFDEPHGMVTTLSEQGDVLVDLEVPPAGDNVRIDVDLPQNDRCGTSQLSVVLCSSGAVGEVVLCQCEDGSAPRDWFFDGDADGFGDASDQLTSCVQPERYVDNSLDCDDTDDARHPGVPEVCNGIDDNCSGEVDIGAVDVIEWYADADEDGFGDPAAPRLACDQPDGHVVNDDDCDDGDGAVFPGAPELPNGVDDDCDGVVDN